MKFVWPLDEFITIKTSVQNRRQKRSSFYSDLSRLAMMAISSISHPGSGFSRLFSLNRNLRD